MMMTTQLTAFISRYYLGSTKDCEDHTHLFQSAVLIHFMYSIICVDLI